MLYPMKMQPVLHVRVWGGDKLARVLHKTLPDDQPYGESWEVHDTTRVANGAYSGRTLASLIEELGEALIGVGNPISQGMPLLLKFLDSSQWLSVQVHPDDALAHELEGDPRGKNEAWIILDAEPHAQIVNGMLPGSTLDQLKNAIEKGTLEQQVSYYEPAIGDALYVEAGTIHALGPGLLVYEIQQSSDVTYRLYDWNRMGVDGRPRLLHINKGLRVSRLEKHLLPSVITADTSRLLETPYFVVERHVLSHQSHTITTYGCFQLVTCVEGSVRLRANDVEVDLATGETALIAAALSEAHLSGAGVVLRSHQPHA